MNRIYRLIWNPFLAMYVPAPESGRGRGKGCGLSALGALVLSAVALGAYAMPVGGEVTAGQGSIGQSGNAMTVNQQSPNLAINWQSFGIGAAESVSFLQPGTAAIALNRVLGGDLSQIHGRLSANGQVWLLNPNGVLFGGGAQVNVGGLVASTLNLSDADFLAGKRSFSGIGGTVTNMGSISAANGGYVALLGGKVSNEGVIQARLGTVALGAGNQITLDFAGDKLLNLQVDQAAVDALVQNKQLIQADGGTVLLSTRAANALLETVVNNTGIIEARTIDSRNGTIKLLGGSVRVAGTLDASAPNEGDGGFIETSGAQVKVDDAARVTTTAAAGKTGQWLIAQTGDYTITPGAGGLSGGTLASQLATNNVTVVAQGATDSGDVHVNDKIDWNSANSLTLSAHRDVKLVKPISSNGTGDVNLRADNAGNCVSGAESCGKISFTPQARISANGGTVNLYYNPAGSNNPADANGNGPSYANPTDFSRYVSLNGGSALNAWMLVNDVNQLQAIDTNRSGTYALGRDIDASATAGWNNGAPSGRGFIPLGSSMSEPFVGAFDGLGHTVTGLAIERGSNMVGTALFARNDGQIRNVGIVGADIKGDSGVAALVGRNHGTVSGSYSTGSVHGYQAIGGLVAFNNGGVVSNSSSSAGVTGFENVGGLVGENAGDVSNSHSTGAVNGTVVVGGLVGENRTGGTVSNSYSSAPINHGSATPSGTNRVGGLVGVNSGVVSDSNSTGAVNGTDYVGGLVGYNDGSIDSSYATGDVTGDLNVGGLLGHNSGSSIGGSYATGDVSGAYWVGGLVGSNSQGSISTSYARGDVSGRYEVGGLVGSNRGSIGGSYATGIVSGIGDDVGGLVGYNVGSQIDSSYATGKVNAGGNYVGGLVGFNGNSGIGSSYATGDVSGSYSVGGLVGYSFGGSGSIESRSSIRNSYATGSVSGDWYVGGLVGFNSYSSISSSYATGKVSGRTLVGGLVGYNSLGGTTINSYWNITTSGQSTSAGGTGLTDAQMKQKASFTGFDLVNIWGIDEGVSYPFLLAH